MLIHQKAIRGVVVAALCVFGLLSARTVNAQACGPMDVVFVVDETGSMGNVIGEIQAQVGLIADEVVKASGNNYSFAMIGMPDNNVDIIMNFSPNNRAELDTAVGQLGTAGGCGGVPYDEALDTAVNLLGARTGTDGAQIGTFVGPWTRSTKIIILITDTWPQGFTCAFQAGVHDVNAHAVAEEAAAQDIHISSVYVPTGNTPEDLIIGMMEDVATTSRGIYREAAPDASDLSDIIVDILQNCGGSTRSGPTSLTVEPTELLLTNSETGTVRINNFDPGSTSNPTQWSAENLGEGWTAKFVTLPNAEDGSERIDVQITPSADAIQGTHLVAIKATRDNGPTNYIIVHVVVDCRAPFFLGTPGHQPLSQSVARGTTARLTATPGGDGPFRYQWYRGPSGSTAFPISGATNAALTTDAVNATGEYWVRVTNPCGSRDSATAVVTPR